VPLSRRLVSITLDNLGDLPYDCRSCVYWELDPAAGAQVRESGDGALEKEAWVSDTLLEWGSCGTLIYVDEKPAGFVLFAPPAYVPRASAFPTSPVSADAVLLMTARILPEFTGGGLGRMLVQGVVRDVAGRGIRAIEAFGGDGPSDVARNKHADCVLPAAFLRAVGFKTVRQHPQFPRLRLDVRSTVTWREDVESAFERLLSTLSPSPAVPAAPS